MQYMGSKSKISGEIVPILQKFIDEKGIKTYIEPFVGGANIIDKINCEKKLGFDKNESLIALLQDAQLGGPNIPKTMSREDWDKWKEVYRNYEGHLIENNISFSNQVAIGATAFFGSFSCRGFSGGMANNTSNRDYYESRRNSLMKQAAQKGFREITFSVWDYTMIPIVNLDETVLIYSDPPYQNTKAYGYKFETGFNHEEYWNWIRECSKKCIVVCSEQTFPDDFEIIWQKQVKRTNGADNNFKAVEKLGIWKG